MNALETANSADTNKRITIKPLPDKKGHGRPKLSPSKRKNKPKSGGSKTHVMKEARKKTIKKEQVMMSIKSEEKRKAKESEQISKSSMMPKDIENFLDYKDDNNDISKVLSSPEMAINPIKPKQYSNRKNQIDQCEQKLQELGNTTLPKLMY